MTLEEILEHTFQCPSGYSWPRRRCCNEQHLECVPGDVNNRRRAIATDRAMNRGE